MGQGQSEDSIENVANEFLEAEDRSQYAELINQLQQYKFPAQEPKVPKKKTTTKSFLCMTAETSPNSSANDLKGTKEVEKVSDLANTTAPSDVVTYENLLTFRFPDTTHTLDTYQFPAKVLTSETSL
jgi:hypothetical protein